MMHKAKVAVCSETLTKPSTQVEHHVEFLMVNLVVRKETARLEKVKERPKYKLTHVWRSGKYNFLIQRKC
jgi:hypothetical protein